MLRASLRAYVPAVLRQWWTYAGIGSGLTGYFLDLFTGLTVPPVAWLAVFGGCFLIANFMVYHDVRMALAMRERGLQVPPWTMHVCSASGDGAWVTTLLIGDAPRQPLDTTKYRELVAAIDRHFGFSEESRKVESFADRLRVMTPKASDGFAPEFLLELGPGRHGALCIQCRTPADPLPLHWMLQRLDEMMAFLLSDASETVVSRKNREYTLCVNALPEGGIDVGDTVTAHRLSQNFVKGSRTTGTYKPAKNDRDGWGVIRAFVSTVLANAGYTEFEPSLAAVTRYSLATSAGADDRKLPHRTSQ